MNQLSAEATVLHARVNSLKVEDRLEFRQHRERIC